MSIRSDILANVTTQLSGTSCKTASELPWSSGNVPLYAKNKKVFYIDEVQRNITPMFLTLDDCDVYGITETVTAYLTVDAKNQPADIETVVLDIIKAAQVVDARIHNLCEQTTETQADEITYVFAYNFESVYKP